VRICEATIEVDGQACGACQRTASGDHHSLRGPSYNGLKDIDYKERLSRGIENTRSNNKMVEVIIDEQNRQLLRPTAWSHDTS